MPIRYYLLLVFAFLFPFLAHAGDQQQWVIQGTPFPRNLIIAVDCSGSMAEQQKYGIAMGQARDVAMNATDDGSIRFYAFDTEAHPDEQGWYKLPDKERVDKSIAFLQKQDFGSGTNISASVKQIFKENQQEELGLLIITDGDPGSDAREDAKAIIKENKARKNPVTIGVFTIHPEVGENTDKFSIVLSKKSAGDYIRLVDDADLPKLRLR